MIKANRKWVLLASIIVMLSVMLSMMPIQAMASEPVHAGMANNGLSATSAGSISATYDGSFDSAWQLSKRSGDASLVYGYNTTLINEDYAWAYNTTQTHWAELYNDNGLHSGDEASAGNVSKIEVRHSGKSITYYCIWA